MAQAAVHSEVVILLLFINCLLLFPLCVGGLCVESLFVKAILHTFFLIVAE